MSRDRNNEDPAVYGGSIKYPRLRAGDSIYIGGKSRVARLIAWFTRGAYEPATKVTHSAPVYDEKTVEEAVWPKVHKISADEFWGDIFSGKYLWVIMRRRVLPTPEALAKRAAYLDSMAGTFYAVLEFMPQAADGFLMKVFPDMPPVFRRLNDLLPNVQCSGLDARADIAAGWADRITRFDSPDDSLDRKLHDPSWYVAETSEVEMLPKVARFFLRKMLNIQGD